MKQVGPADLCPCGSGRTYERCCLPQAEEAAGERQDVQQSSENEIRRLVRTAQEYHRTGRLPQAASVYRQVLRLSPGEPDALHGLGMIARREGRSELAIELVQKALQFRPSSPAFYNTLGSALRDESALDAAVASFLRALELKPDFIEAHANLGNALQAQGRLDAAVESFRRALELRPDFAEVHSNLGNALQAQGKLDAALDSYRRALALRPDFPETRSHVLFLQSHEAAAAPEEVFASHRAFGERYAALQRNWPTHRNPPDGDRRLKVGFVSGDFRNHPVAYFLEPLWAALNPDRFEILAYSNNPRVDDMTLRLKGHARQWRQVQSMSDAAVAGRIEADCIDILIDLSGHTAHNRLPVFALKPAPLQVSWIGYPGTTGLAAMDYYLADRFLAPPGLLDQQFSEKVVRLPAVSTFSLDRDAPAPNALPALSTGSFTFGNFSRNVKLGEATISLWSRVLGALPDSRMLLGGVTDDVLRETLLGRFARHGVDRERLMFCPRVPLSEYLALHHRVDMVLDTVPYTGGTTSVHAVWMGVPVMTLAGRTIGSRQTLAVLNHIGLAEFAVESEAQFVTEVAAWTRRLPELASIRAGLRNRILASPISRPEAVASGVEAALRIMWKRWCAGLPAASFEVQD
jgi:predicted O-linked N-acetylglucosamine transferase (SPINDLY family)